MINIGQLQPVFKTMPQSKNGINRISFGTSKGDSFERESSPSALLAFALAGGTNAPISPKPVPTERTKRASVLEQEKQPEQAEKLYREIFETPSTTDERYIAGLGLFRTLAQQDRKVEACVALYETKCRMDYEDATKVSYLNHKLTTAMALYLQDGNDMNDYYNCIFDVDARLEEERRS